ncbi:MAG: hypothetical protein IPH13_18460 [Planctomycetes bacterium]|nr:hypothetical protein [Planctomycetota bacterium]
MSWRMRCLAPLLAFVVCVVAAVATARAEERRPYAVVTGQVVDAWGHPFDGAVVSLDGADVATRNARGEYWFRTNRTGSHFLEARHDHALPGLSSGTRVELRPGSRFATQVRLWRSASIGGELGADIDRPAWIGIDVRYESMGHDGFFVRAATREFLLGPSFEIHGIDPESRVAVRALGADGKPLGSEVVAEAGWLDLDLGVEVGELKRHVTTRQTGSTGEQRPAAATHLADGSRIASNSDAAVRARERRARRVYGARVDVCGIARGVPDGTMDLPLIVLDHLEKPGVRIQTRTAPDGSFVLFDVPIGRVRLRAHSFTHVSLPIEHEMKPGTKNVPALELRKVVRWRLSGANDGDRAWLVGSGGALVGLPIAVDIEDHTVLTELPLGIHDVLVHDGHALCSPPRRYRLEVTEARAASTDLDVGGAP